MIPSKLSVDVISWSGYDASTVTMALVLDS